VESDNESTTSQALPTERAKAPPSLSDPERWVELYGDYLFKHAMTRLRDPTKAEDAVQETFLAALKGGKAFAGRSGEKSWLVGILKNKICDHYRRASRETPFTDLGFYPDEENGCFVAKGVHKGAWIHELGPREWPHPGESLDHEEFWQAYRDCSGKLPKNVAAVFNLREVDDLDSKRICRMLNISEGNLWVMLHRARMALRRCLETHWFEKKAGGAL
jgi:RNA polymerase sigma-70 factor (ECF subfamily)